MKLRKFCSDNGLSILFVMLFVVFALAQMWSGKEVYNAAQRQHGLAPVGTWAYARTGEFLQGMFANWQAAILQLGSLIVFGIFLHQRGAPHSREPGVSGTGETGRAGLWGWLHGNSLSLVFAVLFVVTFVLHLFSGAAVYNRARLFSHQAPLGVMAFAGSAEFWFSTFQTWEAEYMAIALYLLLSVVLRQEGSPESKPEWAGNEETGEANK